MSKVLFFLVVLSWICTNIPALDPDKTIHQYVHQVWTWKEGLPSNEVRDIFQTSNGYLWVATQQGLARFNGVGFNVFTTANTPELKDNNITTLCECHHGGLWIGTSRAGVLFLKDNRFTSLPEEDPTCSSVETLFEDLEGTLWIGTTSCGLVSFKDGKFRSFSKRDGLIHQTVSVIHFDQKKHLRVGTSRGLAFFNNGTFVNYASPELDGRAVTSILESRPGILWIGTQDGLVRATITETELFTSKHGLPHSTVCCLLMDGDGNIWIGTNKGLARFSDGELSIFTAEDGLIGRQVRSLFEDREGNLWVGTDGGLNQFRDGTLTTYPADGHSYDPVYTVFGDEEGNLWIGGDNGLTRFFKGKTITYKWPKGLRDSSIHSIGLDDNDLLWIGTENFGLFQVTGDTIALWKSFYQRGDYSVYCIFRDRQGHLWFGTNQGLVHYRDGRLISYLPGEKPADTVRAILEDRKGNLWIGTDNGLRLFRDGNFTDYRDRQGAPSHAVYSLFEDENEQLWIATYGDGLFRFQSGQFFPFNTRDGFPNDYLYHILEDGNHHFWISSDRGIIRVSKIMLNKYAEGGIHHIQATLYDTQDGMKSEACTGGNQPAGWKTTDGRLWFPTMSGVVSVDPDHIRRNQVRPGVVVEEVFVNGKKITPVRNPSLSPALKSIEFHFAGLSFVSPERVRLKYKLEGHETEWSDAKNDGKIRYTSLSPGEYIFRVKACNNDGLWNEQGASFHFSVRSPFWLSWWFLFPVIFIFVVVIIFLYRLGSHVVGSMKYWRQSHFIGRYRILNPIGKGGMGTVYRALDRQSKAIVALKLLNPEITTEDSKERFIREGLVTDKISHPNVVRILDRGEKRNCLYYVMDYCQGVTLREKIDEGNVTRRDALAIFTILVEAVHDMHEKGIVHRDLKPENIMITEDTSAPTGIAGALDGSIIRNERIKILDFGLARLVGKETITKTGLITGTLQYVPPEYLGGFQSDARRVDFYSLGVILYEMLTGATPFGSGGEDPAQTMYAVLHEDPVPPEEIDPDIPSALSDFCLQLITKNPKNRLTSFKDIQGRFSRVRTRPMVG